MTYIPTTGAAHPAPVPTPDPSPGPDPDPATGAPATSEPDASAQAAQAAQPSRQCPACGTANPAESSFCEACGADLVVAARAATGTPPAAPPSDGTVLASATPQTAPAG